jgi:hypothetical protein
MAIQEITETELVQRCAKCDGENRVPLAALEVGIEREQQVEDSIVALPECPTCRSREFLVRSPVEEQEHPAIGSSGHLHRLLVDELHSELVKKGRVVAKLRDKADKVFTRPLAVEAKRRFFDKGLKLPARAIEQLQGKEPEQ